MSANELPKSTVTNESNIPVLKRNVSGAKKSKGCSKLPELQRYIESIIKASNEFDSENTSLTDKEKFPKGKQFGKHTVCRGLENKIKLEKLKLDVISNRCKNKRPKSKNNSEAVSSDVEVFHKFISEFEDPRNWKIQNSGSHLKIEKLMKKFYPNPYKIYCENECQNSETHIIFEKVNKKDLEDDTLYDVIISKVDAVTQEDFEKPDIEIVHADIQRIPDERENKTKTDLGLSSENLSQSHNKSSKEDSKDDKFSKTSKISTIPDTPIKSSRIRYSGSTSNISSEISSLESINQVLCKESQVNLKKKKPKVKTKIYSKETVSKDNKSKSTPDDGNQSDYDIGKLKLLNLSDSDNSISKKVSFEKINVRKKNKNNMATDDFVSEISSEICNEISKTNDLNDLLQIYEVMNKATESFLYLTSIKKSGSENKKSAEALNDMQNKKPDSSSVDSELVENEKCPDENEENKNSNVTNCPVEDKSDKGHQGKEIQAFENSPLNVLEEDKKCSAEEKDLVTKNHSEPENEKPKNVCDTEKNEVSSLDQNDCEKAGQMVQDKISDANQKIDEVLEFMNNCLLKFSSDGKIMHQEKKNSEENQTDIESDLKQNTPSTSQEFRPHNSDFKDESSVEGFSHNPEEAQSNHPHVLGKINKNGNTKIRCKRKSEVFTPTLKVVERKNSSCQQLSVTSNERAIINDFDIQPALYPESVVLNNENTLQVAEVQNELGGYTEELQESPLISKEDSRIIKSLLPLPTRVKRRQPQTYKTLKDALETEEKLLTGDFKSNDFESKELISYNPEKQFFMQNDRTSHYSSLGGFEPANPGFVICISPFPQNLRTAAVIAPNLSMPKPLSLSLIDFSSLNLKPLSNPSKVCFMEKLLIPPHIDHRALKCMYKFKLEILSLINNTRVTHNARPVCFISLISFPKIQKDFSLEFSRQQIRTKPLKTLSIAKLNAPETSGFCIRNTLTFTTSKSNVINSSESGIKTNSREKPVEALIKAIQETENVFFLMQNNGSSPLGNFEPFCGCSSNEVLESEDSDSEREKEDNKKKVQDLLMRTCKLQKKLQQYLHYISQIQPKTLPCSSIKQDFGITGRRKAESTDVSLTSTNTEPKELPPLIQRFLQPPADDKNTKADEAVAVNVEMVDRGTIYSPPLKEEEPETVCNKSNETNCKEENFSGSENEEQNHTNLENDDDDRSSTYSFKSSNDFSEINEVQNLIQDSSGLANNRDVIKKIFSEIEFLKQSVDVENLEKQEKKYSDHESHTNSKEEDEFKDNKVVEFDPKNPAKVLKTVFKGRKSSTELTIGLKDVPMTKVNNISVERTKFSANHTKISICISKDKSNEINNSNKLNTKIMPNKVSSYFFDHMRPSLSRCQTEYSKVEDIVSKSSQSLNDRSDEDEEDFKSAGSTLANSATDTDQEKTKPKNQAVIKMSPAKSFTKHKFDFYRKMDTNAEGTRARQKPITNSLWRYKELEPLKQALTELQIRMRSIKREAILNSNDYYERALKLAKMSAGFCQSCGTRAVIPDDTFGYYKTLLLRRSTHNRRNRHFKTTLTPNSSFYSFRSTNAEVSGPFCDLDIKRSSSFLLNRTTHSNRTVLRSSLQDMPILIEKM